MLVVVKDRREVVVQILVVVEVVRMVEQEHTQLVHAFHF